MKRRAFVGSTLATISIPGLSESGVWQRVRQDPGDIEAVTGDGRKVTLRGMAVRELAQGLEGRLLHARSEGYETARHILNPAIDKRPALIAQPGDVDAVRRAVQFAREYGLLLAVKCGGHSFSGQSTCDGGLMIDLQRIRSVRVDPTARRAVVAGGNLLGAVDAATTPHGLVTPLGTVSHTGVGGLTTGGGFGRLARRYGLSVDNLVGVEVVTADGRLLRADANENADLFWGVRGGGGNFGIVTAFTFALHPMQRDVISGGLVYPYSKARDAWELYGEYTVRAPDDLFLGIVQTLPPGGGEGSVLLEVCYSGPERDASRAMAPLAKLGRPVADARKTMPYVTAQKADDNTDPRALSMYLKSGFTRNIDSRMAAEISRALEGRPDRLTMVFAAQCGGAIGRVAESATAFANRDAEQTILAAVGWSPKAPAAPHLAYAREYWKVVEPFTNGFYVNDLSGEERSAIEANYRGNFARLSRLKTKYDPTNLFRLNANILPG